MHDVARLHTLFFLMSTGNDQCLVVLSLFSLLNNYWRSLTQGTFNFKVFKIAEVVSLH